MMVEKDRVNVTLLLGGGHTRSIALDRQDPLLRSLLGTIQAKGRPGATDPVAYHLPVDAGRQSLVFSGADLVGILVDPPLVATAPGKPAGPAVKSRHVLLDDFLEPSAHAALLRSVAAAEERFVDSTVTTNDPDYRRSKILYDIPEVSRMFRERIAAAAPRIMAELGIPAFDPAEVEVQLTAHNDGNYFKLHNDNGSPDTATRGLTYVYYFFNEPKAFSGGELRLYDSVVANGQYQCGSHAEDLDPRNNSILFFAPHCHHEVLPVRCPTGRFADSRFTVNGWLRRPA